MQLPCLGPSGADAASPTILDRLENRELMAPISEVFVVRQPVREGHGVTGPQPACRKSMPSHHAAIDDPGRLEGLPSCECGYGCLQRRRVSPGPRCGRDIARNSSSMRTMSKRVRRAPGSKLTSKSTSLSGPKSSRTAEPNRASSVTPQRTQNAPIRWGDTAIRVGHAPNTEPAPLAGPSALDSLGRPPLARREWWRRLRRGSARRPFRTSTRSSSNSILEARSRVSGARMSEHVLAGCGRPRTPDG